MGYLNLFITPFIAALAGGMATYIWGLPKQKKKEKELEQKKEELIHCRLDMGETALKALLRNEIQKIYDVCYAKGSITSYEKQNLAYLYKSYKQLGGNSYIEKLYEQLMDLPLEEEK